MIIRNLLLSVTAFTLAACASPVTTLANPTVADDTARASGPALWQVADEDTTIYLFGTIHVLPEGIEWYDQRIASAFDASGELVFEISLDDPSASAAQMAALARLEEGQSLRDLMTEADRAEYELALTGLGLPTAAFDPVEPWAAALTLSLLPLVHAGYQVDQGVEMVLRQRGEDKDRAALETLEDQLGLFDSLPMDAQLQMLDATVEAIPDLAADIDALTAEWMAGDADALAALLNDDLSDPELRRRLLEDRNRNWVSWIENRLDRPGTVFIAVGAGHLAGDVSVQALLAERGLIVERIED